VQHERKRDRWTLRSGPFREDEFPPLGDRDWTLLVQDVDKWDMDVRALLAHFRFLPAWRMDDVMISFAVKGGSVGAHVDQYDVFLLQGLGHRRWQIDARPDPPLDFRPDVELKLLREFTPSHDWVLGPGDMLYLPPGVPHHGVAEDHCLTLSFGMRAPSTSELLVDFAEALAELLPEESRYADPDLQKPEDAFEIDEAAMARVKQALAALQTDDATLRAWFGRFITRYRSAGDITPAARAPTIGKIDEALTAGGCLLRHPFARFAWTRDGRRAQLFAHGEVRSMGVRSAARLAAAERIDVDTWASLDGAGKEALAQLTELGHYQLQVPRRRR
ncbi:MAG TPA: cupin domain-containing protein, partial [Arenimonas sp.]|nr:cupin domain-containing protein [Arenimonas sp.]